MLALVVPQRRPREELYSVLQALHPSPLPLPVCWSKPCCPSLIRDLLHAVMCVSGPVFHAHYLPYVCPETNPVEEYKCFLLSVLIKLPWCVCQNFPLKIFFFFVSNLMEIQHQVLVIDTFFEFIRPMCHLEYSPNCPFKKLAVYNASFSFIINKCPADQCRYGNVLFVIFLV